VADRRFQSPRKPKTGFDPNDAPHARAQANGIHFEWLTFDEWYGAKPQFLSALVGSKQKYVGEIHQNHRVWAKKPVVVTRPYRKNGRKSKKTPRLASGTAKAMTVKDSLPSNHKGNRVSSWRLKCRLELFRHRKYSIPTGSMVDRRYVERTVQEQPRSISS